MDINVVIVDDDKFNAQELLKSINNYKSFYEAEGIEYKVIKVFDTVHAFVNARNYLSHLTDKIDILLVDYNLGAGLGTDLFRLVKNQNQIYKILHSETDNSLDEAQDDYRKSYNKFCRSKKEETIGNALKDFEEKVLGLKLYGNKVFIKKHFIDQDFKLESGKMFGGIKFFDILYAKSEPYGESGNYQITIFYRDTNSREIHSLSRTSQRLSFFTEGLLFKNICKDIAINFLWVTRIDINENKIRFLSLDNTLFELSNITISEKYLSGIKPFIPELDEIIPSFLKD